MSKLILNIRSPWAIAIVIVIIAVSVRVAWSGSSALERGRESLANGDTTIATHHFREAISWVLPVAPWREDAADALWAIYQGQVKDGNLKEAVQSLSMLRAGWMAGRSLFGVDEEWLEKVDAALAPLMAQWELKAAVQEGRSVNGNLREREAHFAQLLKQETLPSRAFGFMAIIGFFSWVYGAWRASSLDGPKKRIHLGVAALGIVFFVIGLTLA